MVWLKYNNPNLSEIVVNPLHNVLICIVWEENEGKLPSSPDKLNQMIVYSIAKRYCTKNGIPFEGGEIPSNIKVAIQCLGKLSWDGLQQDQLHFNIDDIKEKYRHNADDMLAIGLLTRDNSFSRIKRTCFCAFLHKTFQEYLAAYYISDLVKKESSRKEGKECLRSLFGMTEATASNVDMKLMSANRRRYREVQNMLLPILDDSSDPLFEMFAEELSKDGCKGEEKDILSFFCIAFLCRTCGSGKTECRMAEIVAPCLSQHITNDMSKKDADIFGPDAVMWIDGLIQVLRCQRILAMSHDPRLIQHLTVDYQHVLVRDLLKQQLDMLENLLSDWDTIRCVTLLQTFPTSSVPAATTRVPFVTSEGHIIKCFPIRTFIPRRGTRSVQIDFKCLYGCVRGSPLMNNILEVLAEISSLQHVNISISRNTDSDSHYDSLLSIFLMKQSCLRSVSVKIDDRICDSKEPKGFGNLTATLQSISEHATLDVVELEQPVNIVVVDSPVYKSNMIVAFDVESMVHTLTECVNRNKILKGLRLSWKISEHGESICSHDIVYKGICSSQSLSELCLAIQGNRTLEILTIDGMFFESEGHQEIIDQLMRNKPDNFEELRITMFNYGDYVQYMYNQQITLRDCSGENPERLSEELRKSWKKLKR